MIEGIYKKKYDIRQAKARRAKVTVKKPMVRIKPTMSSRKFCPCLVWLKSCEKTDRLPAAYIASSDWLIEKPNSSKLIGIINSTRRDRSEKREGAS